MKLCFRIQARWLDKMSWISIFARQTQAKPKPKPKQCTFSVCCGKQACSIRYWSGSLSPDNVGIHFFTACVLFLFFAAQYKVYSSTCSRTYTHTHSLKFTLLLSLTSKLSPNMSLSSSSLPLGIRPVPTGAAASVGRAAAPMIRYRHWYQRWIQNKEQTS